MWESANTRRGMATQLSKKGNIVKERVLENVSIPGSKSNPKISSKRLGVCGLQSCVIDLRANLGLDYFLKLSFPKLVEVTNLRKVDRNMSQMCKHATLLMQTTVHRIVIPFV